MFILVSHFLVSPSRGDMETSGVSLLDVGVRGVSLLDVEVRGVSLLDVKERFLTRGLIP